MSAWRLNLVVLRVADLSVAAKFYGLFGLKFTAEKHGRGPEHLAAESAGCVLELYPRGDRSTSDVRLGFEVTGLAEVVTAVEQLGGQVISPPVQTNTAKSAVIADPDGHRIELFQRLN